MSNIFFEHTPVTRVSLATLIATNKPKEPANNDVSLKATFDAEKFERQKTVSCLISKILYFVSNPRVERLITEYLNTLADDQLFNLDHLENLSLCENIADAIKSKQDATNLTES